MDRAIAFLEKELDGQSRQAQDGDQPDGGQDGASTSATGDGALDGASTSATGDGAQQAATGAGRNGTIWELLNFAERETVLADRQKYLRPKASAPQRTPQAGKARSRSPRPGSKPSGP